MEGLTVSHFVVLSAVIFCLASSASSPAATPDPDGIELIQLGQHQLRRLRALRRDRLRRPGVRDLRHQLAAAEAAVGLAIILGIYQTFETIDVDATDRLRG